jgi:transcriptional regulator
VYVPAHFKPSEADVQELLAHLGAADLITVTASGLLATMLPLVFDAPGSRPDAGPAGSLLGHVARNNRQWREPALGEALVIARGPDAYVSPQWYPTKREHGRVVPTWNYSAVHLSGTVRVHHEPEWLHEAVERLTVEHEHSRAQPWQLTDAPGPYIQGQLAGIVGLEISVQRVEAKAKLSQNRSLADRRGVVDGLRAEEGAEAAAVADAMEADLAEWPQKPVV